MIAKLRTIISRLKLFLELELAFADAIETHNIDIYALKEKVKLLDATVLRLNTQYLELVQVIGYHEKNIN